EDHLLRARQAVDEYLTTISESQLLDVPTLEPVRLDLLSRAKEFYEGFLESRSGDARLEGELAATYIRLGQVTHELDGQWLPLIEQGLSMLEQLEARGVSLADIRSWREG